MTDYDRDPAALAWARAHIQQPATKQSATEQPATHPPDELREQAEATMAEVHAQTHNSGPSVRECAEADNAHWTAKYAREEP